MAILGSVELGLFCAEGGDLSSVLEGCRGGLTSIESGCKRFGHTAGEGAGG